MAEQMEPPAGTDLVPVAAGDFFVFTLMDTADVERLGDRRLALGSHGYAQLYWDKRVTLLHRWILGLDPGDRRIGDHINGNPLDNRRANLRAVTAGGSSQNVGGHGQSGYRGVYPTRNGRWEAKVKVRGKSHYLGTFDSRETAAVAADAKRRELMTDYAGIRAGRGTHSDVRTAAERESRRVVSVQIRTWARAHGCG
jgi:hypothetical protein